MIMKNLQDYFGVSLECAEQEDIIRDINALILASELTGGEAETLLYAFSVGQMDSGDTPSKVGRGDLLGKGILCQTCSAENDYTFSVTYPLGCRVIDALKLL
tara:strand:- start:207 stop:512 length:306 start_codon:yes stop_codon:yes gene_type:complete